MSGIGQSTSPKYRADMDGLRAVAVLPVVFYHFQIVPFTGGFVGVDIFFVISGYLIRSLIHPKMLSGAFSPAQFYERRVRRILPALFLMLLVTTALAGAVLFSCRRGIASHHGYRAARTAERLCGWTRELRSACRRDDDIWRNRQELPRIQR